MGPSVKRTCKDCAAEGIATKRKAPYPGPRCATHHRARRKRTRDYSHQSHVEATYGITYEQYWAIYEAQGGRCAICRRASGHRRKLAVDHDHRCCKGRTSCGRCVRSLCCSACNKMLGHLRDDPEMVERILLYLINPPGKEILRGDDVLN